HLVDRLAQGLRDVRRQAMEDVGDGQLRILALAEQMRRGGSDDEEWKERDDCQISEIAGVNEAVVIDADHDPLDHLPRSDSRLQLLLDLGAEGGPQAGKPLAPGFRGLGGIVSHSAKALNTQRRARVAPASPRFGELLQLFVVRRNVDLDRDQLVAALAVLAGKAAVLEAQDLARGCA